jgi:hypothetical protein
MRVLESSMRDLERYKERFGTSYEFIGKGYEKFRRAMRELEYACSRTICPPFFRRELEQF